MHEPSRHDLAAVAYLNGLGEVHDVKAILLDEQAALASDQKHTSNLALLRPAAKQVEIGETNLQNDFGKSIQVGWTFLLFSANIETLFFIFSNVHQNVHDALNELEADQSAYIPEQVAEELFHLPDCVQIFFISSGGKVSTFSEPSTLRIFRFKEKLSDSETQTFIQVGGWTHPLIPGASPVLEAANGAFMFPDVYGEDDSSSVGIVIADDSPFNIDGDAHKHLAKLLEELTALKKEEVTESDLKLGKIGFALVKGAEMVGKSMEKGAVKATHLIEYVSEKQKAKIEAAEEDKKVNPAIKTSVKGAKYATKATVKVSGFVANRVGKLSKGLSNYLAKKMEPSVTGMAGSGAKKPKSSSMSNLVDAARGGLLAYGTVYASLESSAKVLGNSVKDESVEIVQKKYGGEAGNVYEEAMTAAGNGFMTYMHISSLGVKGLVKKTAKDTGKQLGKAVLDAHSGKKET